MAILHMKPKTASRTFCSFCKFDSVLSFNVVIGAFVAIETFVDIGTFVAIGTLSSRPSKYLQVPLKATPYSREQKHVSISDTPN